MSPDLEAGEEENQPSPDLLGPPGHGEDQDNMAREKTSADPMEEEEKQGEELVEKLGLCDRIEQNGMDGSSQEMTSAELPVMGGMAEGSSRAERTPRTPEVVDETPGDGLNQAVRLPGDSSLSPCGHDTELPTGQPATHKGELQQNLYARQSTIHWSTSGSAPTDLSVPADTVHVQDGDRLERYKKARLQPSERGAEEQEDEENSGRLCEDTPGELGLDGKFSLWPEDSKPHLVCRPIKTEETKEEDEELPLYPHDAPDVKPSNLLGYSGKTESLEPKTEELEFSVKPEEMETKSEDLSFSTKAENHLELASYGLDGSGIKSESKPESVDAVGFPDRTELKPETKGEGLEFDGYPDCSEIKSEAKREGPPGLTDYPDTKVETKREFLEADSTVPTPKLEQGEGLPNAAETLEVKVQMKEEQLKTPGTVCIFYVNGTRLLAFCLSDVTEALCARYCE